MPSIPWRPRVILPDRSFRLPVQAIDDNIALTADHFETIATRWCERDTARYYYLRSPQKQGDYTLIATHNGNTAKTTIQVRTLDDLRQPHTYNGAQWPRRWPLGQNYQPTKTRQTLQNDPKSERFNEETLAYWSSQPDHVLWSQLPPAELPKAHFANCHQGCPNCGTAIFKYSGFYPWERNHLPCDFKSQCPNCASIYPSNNLTKEDYTSNDFLPDGTPLEATGGYNAIHSDGLFDLEYHLRNLRTQQPDAYPESLYPSLFKDPRGARVPRALCEITMIGKSYFQFGDGSAPGSAGTRAEDSIRLENDLFHPPMNASVLERAIAFTSDPHLEEIQATVQNKQHRALGPTILDGAGIAILRTQLSHRSHRTTRRPQPPPHPGRHLYPGTRKNHRYRRQQNRPRLSNHGKNRQPPRHATTNRNQRRLDSHYKRPKRDHLAPRKNTHHHLHRPEQ